MPERRLPARNRRKQLIWLAGLWAASVSVVALAAELLRLLMSAVGMTSH